MTMNCKWHFNRHRPGDPMDDPIQGEYFSDESISNPGDSLIREGIQNSLDACRKREKVLVRIRVSERGASGKQVAPFFGDLWEHLSAPRNGLREAPTVGKRCPYLLFEDFGTVGLTGDPMLDWSCEETENHFFHFFRAAGRSDKEDKDRGCWGVGKTVFPRSSAINAWFGLTVPEDRRNPLLMGRVVLKHHEVKGHRYTPNGFFGEPPENGDGIVSPVEDPGLIRRFVDAFDIQRNLDDPGLSVVVPWYEVEDLTDKNIIRSLLRHCFWPILMDQLEVLIEPPETHRTVLDKDHLAEEMQKLGDDISANIAPFVELAQWAIDENYEPYRLSVPVPAYSYKWEDVPRDETIITEIKEKLDQRQPVAVRVPFTIRTKNDEEHPSYFDVFLRRENDQWKESSVFIRSDITIPDVKAKLTPGVTSLVVIEDESLTTALRHAENPSHRQWQKDAKQKDGLRFKDRYKYADSIIRFITGSPRGLMSLLSSLDAKPDKNLLADIFSIPDELHTGGIRLREKRKNKKSGKDGDGKPRFFEPEPRPILIDKIESGFIVRNGNGQGMTPNVLLIRAAYHIRGKNPFKKYHPADFDFSHHMKIEIKGARILQKKENKLRVSILDSSFRIQVTGFDPKRDVRVEIPKGEIQYANSDN